ncbi:ABC transporter permease [Streptomyces sp. H10-C2]|uniref:FtsX-like permease family protein n=1 Tax=unclassified Streptomyces TaxID=2593676 RepID=UPI0024BBE307|nr:MULTISPECIES: ABC transporter permease [unclassified Streptomyces]MDJ0340683.1 ABC transporter permease [Streptomyces sp. PH10-H1]MDJ0372045.1 ABC transporter permease [Streptomyces sp. H10-C2]
MFVALRDIRFAKGRFALMGAVVTLITTLVVFLYGLTGGLGRDASSAIAELPANDIVFGAPAGASAGVSFSNSTISDRQAAAWAATAGVTSAEPLGVAMTRATGAAAAGSVSLFGGSAKLLPPLVSGSAPKDGQVAVSQSVADTYQLVPGSTLGLGTERVTVSGITATRSYGHAASVWTTLSTWQRISGQRQATALAVGQSGADLGAADATQGTRAVARGDALAGIDGYQAEHLSLQMIQVFLFAVSALVTGAFFTVWTVQRKPDVAVLKAVGASSGYLVRDALAQALAVLAGGALLGGAIGAGGGAIASSVVPFAVGPATVAVPVAVMVLLGLAGSAFAIARITSVDPLTALGANR